MGSYCSITNDTKDVALTYLGPDMKVLQISIGVLSGLLMFVPGVGDILGGIGESVEAAVDDGIVTAAEAGSEAGSEDVFELTYNFLKDAPEEDRQWFRNKLNSATFSFKESSVGTIDIEADVEGFDDLPDVPEPRPQGQPWTKAMVTKGMVSSAILEGVAQGIIRSYKKHHYHVVMPGHTLKSGKKSLSLLMQYNATKISHDGKELHCWSSEHAVWSGKTKNSVNKYYLTDRHFHWKKTLTCKLNIKNKAPLISAAVAVPNNKTLEVEVVRRPCQNHCLPTLLCGHSAAATVIKEEGAKHA